MRAGMKKFTLIMIVISIALFAKVSTSPAGNQTIKGEFAFIGSGACLFAPGFTDDTHFIPTGPSTMGPNTWEGIYTTNNVANEATDIGRVTPDLQVTSVVPQPPAYSGEKVTVSWTVKNVGDAPVWHGTDFWYDAVYLSRDPVFNKSRATYLGSFIHNHSDVLDVNESYTNTQQVTLPPGTEGAVSLEGTVGGFLGALAVGATGVLTGLFDWPAALLVAVAGLLGSLAESVLGTVAERRGWMDNNLLNAANTAIGALFAILILRVL